MALTVQNLAILTQGNVKIGEALSSIQQYVNRAVATPTGNKVPPPPPKFVNPGKQ